MKKFLFLLVIVLFFAGCDKKEDIITPPDNTVDYAYIPATENVVMYEVNLRAFGGNASFSGLINRLDSIKSLGTNVIWLMPIYPIGVTKTVNSPYCVKNYTQVNSEFGTLADFKLLVKAAHDRKMAVVLDWVANHTSWDNPWIFNKAWYTQDNAGNIIIAAGTNWQDVADLNYSNTEMRAEMIKSMKYWVTETGIDGFRCDAADMVPFDFWKEAITSIKTATDKKLIFLAEGSRKDHFTAGFQMNYAWDFYTEIKKVFTGVSFASSLYTVNQTEYAGLPAGSRKLRFTTNHDESAWDKTPMQLFSGKKGALAASVITYFMNGSPLIYSSQEVGVTATVPFFSRTSIDWNLNPDMVKAYQNMMSVYNNNTAARIGTLETFNHNTVVCFSKSYDGKELLVIANTRVNSTVFTLPAKYASTTWKNAITNADVTLGTTLNLGDFEYVLLKR